MKHWETGLIIGLGVIAALIVRNMLKSSGVTA